MTAAPLVQLVSTPTTSLISSARVPWLLIEGLAEACSGICKHTLPSSGLDFGLGIIPLPTACPSPGWRPDPRPRSGPGGSPKTLFLTLCAKQTGRLRMS